MPYRHQLIRIEMFRHEYVYIYMVDECVGHEVQRVDENLTGKVLNAVNQNEMGLFRHMELAVMDHYAYFDNEVFFRVFFLYELYFAFVPI